MFLAFDGYEDPQLYPCDYGRDWLDQTKCRNVPAGSTTNYLPALLSGGYVGGVVLQVNWDQFAADTGALQDSALYKILVALNSLASPSRQINLSVGLIAGTHTPCGVLAQEALYDPSTRQNDILPGIWLNTPGQPSDTCAALPVVHQTGPNSFAGAYKTAFGNLIMKIQYILGSFTPSNLTVAAIKVGGLNGRNYELTIPGDNQYNNKDGTSNNSFVCNGQALQYKFTCYDAGQTSGADAWLQKYGYYPAGVRDTWSAVVAAIQSGQSTFTSRPVIEVNVQGPQQVPPIAGTDSPSNFGCYNPNSQTPNGVPCQVYNGNQGKTVTNDFVEGVLLTDLINGTGSFPAPIAPSTVAIQFDGLIYNSDNDSQNLTEDKLVGLPTCWAYNNSWSLNGHTIIGFQSSTSQTVAGDGSNYLTSLTNGVDLGAQYEELIPSEVNQYMNIPQPIPQQHAAYLASVQSSLIANTNGSFCK